MLYCSKEDCLDLHARVENLEWQLTVLEETLRDIVEHDCDGLGVNLREVIHDYKDWARRAMDRVL